MRNPFRKPCICPVRFRDYLTGLRCQRHGDSTEAAMPESVNTGKRWRTLPGWPRKAK